MAQKIRPRKHTLHPRRTPGFEAGIGKKVLDGVNGDPIPKKYAIKQRGVWVSVYWRDGSRDRPNTYDG